MLSCCSGHEVKALFISTVRTSVSNLEHDKIYDTGFVNNVKRFNTALSRAVALVVIVGDVAVLLQAAEWRETIAACREHGCFVSLQAPCLPPQAPPPILAPHPQPLLLPLEPNGTLGQTPPTTTLTPQSAYVPAFAVPASLPKREGRNRNRRGSNRADSAPANENGETEGEAEAEASEASLRDVPAAFQYGRQIDVNDILGVAEEASPSPSAVTESPITSCAPPMHEDGTGTRDSSQRQPDGDSSADKPSSPLPEWAQEPVLPPDETLLLPGEIDQAEEAR